MPAKGKKTKVKTMDLMDFLAQANAASAATPSGFAVKTSFVERQNEYDDEPMRMSKTVVLPTAPKASRGIDMSTIPDEPPFAVQFRNLPYNFTEDKVEEIVADLKVERIHMPMDGLSQTNRGMAFIELASRDDMLAALELHGTSIGISNTRTLQVFVAPQAGKGSDSGRWSSGQQRGSGNQMRTEFESREEQVSDWRRAPRQPTVSRDDDYRRSFPTSRMDNFDRSQMRQSNANSLPRERPKLELEKRTIPLDDSPAQVTPSERASSIFGGAKPVDTRKREMDILASKAAKDEQKQEDSARLEEKRRHKIFGEAKPVDTRQREMNILANKSAQDEHQPADSAKSEEKRKQNIFGEAKPVDTRACEERILASKPSNTPVSVQTKRRQNIFGDAKPVDTAAKEHKILNSRQEVAKQDVASSPSVGRPDSRTQNRSKTPDEATGDDDSWQKSRLSRDSRGHGRQTATEAPPAKETADSEISNKFSLLLSCDDSDDSSDGAIDTHLVASVANTGNEIAT